MRPPDRAVRLDLAGTSDGACASDLGARVISDVEAFPAGRVLAAVGRPAAGPQLRIRIGTRAAAIFADRPEIHVPEVVARLWPTPEALGAAVGALPVPVDRVDTDGDGLDDPFERVLGTDPANPDSDADGIWDGFEQVGATGLFLRPDDERCAAQPDADDGMWWYGLDGRLAKEGGGRIVRPPRRAARVDTPGVDDAQCASDSRARVVSDVPEAPADRVLAGVRRPADAPQLRVRIGTTVRPARERPELHIAAWVVRYFASPEALGAAVEPLAALDLSSDRVDVDEDGLDDRFEAVLGTDPSNPDSDGDGVWDGFDYAGASGTFFRQGEQRCVAGLDEESDLLPLGVHHSSVPPGEARIAFAESAGWHAVELRNDASCAADATARVVSDVPQISAVEILLALDLPRGMPQVLVRIGSPATSVREDAPEVVLDAETARLGRRHLVEALRSAIPRGATAADR